MTRSLIPVCAMLLVLVMSLAVFAQDAERDSFERDGFSDERYDDYYPEGRESGGFEDGRGQERRPDERYPEEGYRPEDEGFYRGEGPYPDEGRYEGGYPEEHYPDDFRSMPQDPEEMVFEHVFEIVSKDLDEREIMSMCRDPSEIADRVIALAREKLGDLSAACDRMESAKDQCLTHAEEMCGHFGNPDLSQAYDEREKLEMMAYSCPPDREAMMDLCVRSSTEHTDMEREYIEEDCRYEWEDHGQQNQRWCELEKQDAICDKGAFMDDCLGRYEVHECPDVSIPDEVCGGYWDQEYDNNGCITSYFCVETEEDTAGEEQCGDYSNPVCGEDGVTYHNDCLAEQAGVAYEFGECRDCRYTEEELERKRVSCSDDGGIPKDVVDGDCVIGVECVIEDTSDDDNQITGQVAGFDEESQCEREWQYQELRCEELSDCTEEGFISSCIEQRQRDIERSAEQSARYCKRDVERQFQDMVRECSRMEKEEQRCYEEAEERCSRFGDAVGTCREILTEERLREYIEREAAIQCRMMENRVLGGNPGEVAQKLKQLDAPYRVKQELERESSDILEVSSELEEFEKQEAEKGLGYKLKLFLGFAKESEENEIANLEKSKERLEASIQSLSALVEQIEDETTAAILREQAAELERQKADIEDLIEKKRKKSDGLLRLFGLFG